MQVTEVCTNVAPHFCPTLQGEQSQVDAGADACDRNVSMSRYGKPILSNRQDAQGGSG